MRFAPYRFSPYDYLHTLNLGVRGGLLRDDGDMLTLEVARAGVDVSVSWDGTAWTGRRRTNDGLEAQWRWSTPPTLLTIYQLLGERAPRSLVPRAVRRPRPAQLALGGSR
jgi:hypothetical protein